MLTRRPFLVLLGCLSLLPSAAPAHVRIGPAGWELPHEHPSPDTEGAKAMGFVVGEIVDNSDPARKAMVGRKFAQPIADSLRPGVPFGFNYMLRDFDKDGFQDVALVMLMDLGPDVEVGAPTYAYRFDGKDWHKMLEGRGLNLGIKEVDGKPDEILLTRAAPETNQRYEFKDGSYQPVDPD